jgi:hypothetical protein
MTFPTIKRIENSHLCFRLLFSVEFLLPLKSSFIISEIKASVD